MAPTFIHLRIHTEFSLSDGLVKIDNLIDKASAHHMPAVAITDQSNLFAVIKFYKAAMLAGIKPIIGADIWLENEKEPEKPFRLTLFCQNDQGYKNLLELISKSFLEGQAHDKAIIKHTWLYEFSLGLIVLSGAEEGDVGQALLMENNKHAAQLITF